MALGIALLAGLAAMHVRALSFAARRAGRRRLLAARPRPRARRPAAVGRRAGGVARRGRPRRRDRRRRPRRRPARPALRLLRLGRDDRPDPARDRRQAGGDPQLRRLRGPARGRHAVDGRRARGAAPRAARASSTRCSTCSAPARCWPAPTTTAPAAAPRPPRRPPTCSTSSGRPTTSGASSGSARARQGRSARRACCRRSARGTARTRPASCGWSRRSRSVVVDGSAEGVAALAADGRGSRPASPTRATSRRRRSRGRRRS